MVCSSFLSMSSLRPGVWRMLTRAAARSLRSLQLLISIAKVRRMAALRQKQHQPKQVRKRSQSKGMLTAPGVAGEKVSVRSIRRRVGTQATPTIGGVNAGKGDELRATGIVDAVESTSQRTRGDALRVSRRLRRG